MESIDCLLSRNRKSLFGREVENFLFISLSLTGIDWDRHLSIQTGKKCLFITNFKLNQQGT